MLPQEFGALKPSAEDNFWVATLYRVKDTTYIESIRLTNTL